MFHDEVWQTTESNGTDEILGVVVMLTQSSLPINVTTRCEFVISRHRCFQYVEYVECVYCIEPNLNFFSFSNGLMNSGFGYFF